MVVCQHSRYGEILAFFQTKILIPRVEINKGWWLVLQLDLDGFIVIFNEYFWHCCLLNVCCVIIGLFLFHILFFQLFHFVCITTCIHNICILFILMAFVLNLTSVITPSFVLLYYQSIKSLLPVALFLSPPHPVSFLSYWNLLILIAFILCLFLMHFIYHVPLP